MPSMPDISLILYVCLNKRYLAPSGLMSLSIRLSRAMPWAFIFRHFVARKHRQRAKLLLDRPAVHPLLLTSSTVFAMASVSRRTWLMKLSASAEPMTASLSASLANVTRRNGFW